MLQKQVVRMCAAPDLTVYDDFNARKYECRACLAYVSKADGFRNIYLPWNTRFRCEGLENTIAKNLASLANIEITHIDSFPKILCRECCMKLLNACRFISMVKKSDAVLKTRKSVVPIEKDKEWPKPIQVDKSIGNNLCENRMELEVKQEVISDEEYENTNRMEEGYRSYSDTDIKQEPEDMESPHIKVTVNGTIPVDQMGAHHAIISNGVDVYEDEEYLDTTVKEEPMSEDEDQMPTDLPLDCILCTKMFHSVSGLKAHVIAQHSYKSVKRKSRNSSPEKKTKDKLVCATCRRSFVTSTDLMVHETCHNKSVCYSCTQKFDTFDQLTKHRKKCQVIINKEAPKPVTLGDVIRPLPFLQIEPLTNKSAPEKSSDTLKCSDCSEEFSDSYYMKIHHEIHHAKEQDKEVDSNERKKSESTDADRIETEKLQHMFEQIDKSEQNGSNDEKEKEQSDQKTIEKESRSVRKDKNVHENERKRKVGDHKDESIEQNESKSKEAQHKNESDYMDENKNKDKSSDRDKRTHMDGEHDNDGGQKDESKHKEGEKKGGERKESELEDQNQRQDENEHKEQSQQEEQSEGDENKKSENNDEMEICESERKEIEQEEIQAKNELLAKTEQMDTNSDAVES